MSFSMGQAVLCLFLQLFLYHIYIQEKEKTFTFYEKSCISLRCRHGTILSLSFFCTTEKDQTCIIAWVKLGPSPRDQLCLFLHFFLYNIYIQEKEKIFLSIKKNLSLCSADMGCCLGELVHFIDNTRRSNVYNLRQNHVFGNEWLWVFLKINNIHN